MKPKIRIALFKGRGLMSAAIRWQSRSAYSHAAVVTPNGTIIEAWQGRGAGVREKHLGDWTGVDVFDIPELTPGQSDIAWAWLNGRVREGCKYDYWGVARFISRRSAKENNKWFCSELVFEAFNECHFPLLVNIPAWKVYPGMLSYSPRITPLCGDQNPMLLLS